MKRILMVTAIAALSACAANPTPSALAPSSDAVTVLVQNDAAVEATVYAVDGPSRFRLGEVPASGSARFSSRNIRSGVVFYVATRWDNNGASDAVDAVSPGDRIRVKIDPEVRAVSAWRQ